MKIWFGLPITKCEVEEQRFNCRQNYEIFSSSLRLQLWDLKASYQIDKGKNCKSTKPTTHLLYCRA
jgi:hypothetical protein